MCITVFVLFSVNTKEKNNSIGKIITMFWKFATKKSENRCFSSPSSLIINKKYVFCFCFVFC